MAVNRPWGPRGQDVDYTINVPSVTRLREDPGRLGDDKRLPGGPGDLDNSTKDVLLKRLSRKALTGLQSRILFMVRYNPGLSKCEICRALNSRYKFYCGDKKCFANIRKRSGAGSWKNREILPHNCLYPLSTVRGALRSLEKRGLISIRREKKEDGRNRRGWDWMKLSYPI
jgi:DNA-binding transcriptional ArsR family regulator